MKLHRLALTAAALFALGCADAAPTGPALADEAAHKINTNRAAGPMVLNASGALEDGGTFAGVVTVQRFDLTEDGKLQVTGVLNGTTTTVNGVTHTITDKAFTTTATLASDHAASFARSAAEGAAQQQNGGCQILFLDIGPIYLDLLGLQLDLSQIVLDLTAQPGAGNLLGNLLCAVVNLLNGPALFSAVTNLLDQVNTLLGSVGG